MMKRLDDPTSPSKEIKHFTNRDTELSVFRRAMDKPTLPLPVQMFYGVGGIGKSWLVTRLSKLMPSDVPFVRLDFDNERYHNDSGTALATIRRGFDSVDCVRFDTAYGWMQAKQGAEGEPTMRGSTAAGNVWEAIRDGGQALAADIPGSNIVGWLMDKLAGPVWDRIKNLPSGRWLLSRAGQNDWLRLKQMSADDILAELSKRLLTDLKEELPTHHHKRACRGVIFLDTYEALKLGIGGEAQFRHRQRWVRRLYAPDSPVLLVISGRDPLQWEQIGCGVCQSRAYRAASG